MSVSCEMYVGPTIDVFTDLRGADWEIIHAFEEKYPELDKYNHHWEDYEDKLLLISDGMCGEFCRLCFVDRYRDEANIGNSNEYITLPMPGDLDTKRKISKMKSYYEELTGEPFPEDKVEYAMWTLWG